MLSLEIAKNTNDQSSFLKYCLKVFYFVRHEVYAKADRRKYKVREPIILATDFIKWNSTPPKTLDLFYYVTTCLLIEKTEDGCIIKVNDKAVIPGSTTLVKDLVRLLEYGCNLFPAYPVIRDVLASISQHV